MKLITTAEAAENLGVHRTRVQALIRTGRLPALLLGGTYIIEEKDLALVADRKPGRPPLTDKEKAERAAQRATENGANGLPFEPTATTAKPKARAKKTVKKAAKKKGATK